MWASRSIDADGSGTGPGWSPGSVGAADGSASPGIGSAKSEGAVVSTAAETTESSSSRAGQGFAARDLPQLSAQPEALSAEMPSIRTFRTR